mmetsp:Transcript_9378/g.28014  ORF Transcript_9378/g.28014 Transcript_9378/m.28014 type:complete len:122 (-) Transcript_9378:118-483(-)|eukprot:CAMPEP_0172357712 /NCGR_PEP_ID=MMETSP1060-20121228/2065_1 /TAXON_ID=37318 /ORGANISM="Pseudo-nitzschia pungens, Strain cf. cingulata" /LENGTH=121 /DNA_ID=CAMNT_0013078523 /DNA_START=1079 /DNA_END=1444 /DNA_ORIENTATION=-
MTKAGQEKSRHESHVVNELERQRSIVHCLLLLCPTQSNSDAAGARSENLLIASVAIGKAKQSKAKQYIAFQFLSSLLLPTSGLVGERVGQTAKNTNQSMVAMWYSRDSSIRATGQGSSGAG